jgi:hypothetical protein
LAITGCVPSGKHSLLFEVSSGKNRKNIP